MAQSSTALSDEPVSVLNSRCDAGLEAIKRTFVNTPTHPGGEKLASNLSSRGNKMGELLSRL